MTVNDITDEMICAEWESTQMRTCVRLMMARATSEERAVIPAQYLPAAEAILLDLLGIQGYVVSKDGLVWLTDRGMLIANMGLRKIFEKYIWKDNEVIK